MHKLTAETPDPRYSDLYRIGGVACLILVGLIGVAMVLFVGWPPPDTVLGHFARFQENALMGLLGLDVLYMISNVFVLLQFLALYLALRNANPSLTLIAVTFGLVSIATLFASNTSFEMLTLSRQYAAATTDAQRAIPLAAGEAMLATYVGTGFDAYYYLNGFAIILFCWVMLHSTVFSRVTGWLGLTSGLLVMVPATAGRIGLICALLALVLTVPWLTLSGLRLLRIARSQPSTP